MNSVSLIGRLTRDPEVRYGQASQTAVARFSIAIDRGRDRDGNDRGADFPNIVCFGKTAELVEKYLGKGRLVGITGRIQTGSYTNKEGRKVYTTEVVVEEQDFCESKNSAATSGGSTSSLGSSAAAPNQPTDDFVNIPDGVDEELPFT